MKNNSNRIRIFDPLVLFPILLLLFLVFPFFNNPLCSDAGWDFENAKEFYKDGLSVFVSQPIKLSINQYPMHPPFKYLLASVFFRIGGINRYSYVLMGILIGIIGVLSIYGLGKKMGGRSIGLISALLLAGSPLYLSNALHSLTDFQVTSLILAALYFYSHGNYFRYGLVTTAATFTKETALVFPIAIAFTDVIYALYGKKFQTPSRTVSITRWILLALPLLLYFIWYLYLKERGMSEWGYFIFAETKNRGAFVTVLYNLLTFNYFNDFARQHIFWLLYLNFNWVYWLCAILGLLSLLKYRKRLLQLFSSVQYQKTVIATCLFFLGYVMTVLTFQTYAIPRYHLPVLPFLYIASAIFLRQFITKHTLLGVIFISVISFTSLYYSIDPISRLLWNEKTIFGQVFYNVVDDNMVYNLQFPLLLKGRIAHGIENICSTLK